MSTLDSVGKLEMLSQQMALEPAEEAGQVALNPNGTAPCGHSPAELQRVFGSEPERESVSLTQQKKNALGLHDAVVPGGKRCRLLKTMLTSACERNCYYCPFRAGRNFRRATFKPEEMANTFSQLNKANIAEGFSSVQRHRGGRRKNARSADRHDAILRRKLDFRGYLHLKLMPGSERDQVLACDER